MSKAAEYIVQCLEDGCGYRAAVISKKEADRHAKAHASTGDEHLVTVNEEVPLPTQALVGDRVKLKPEKVAEFKRACEAAGWRDVSATLERPKTVLREDNYNPGGGRRLFFDGPPYCYGSSDVVLAWSSVGERRAALKRAGHKV